ncbi:hypothetical protein [Viridibacterium curvum]|uniref:hypothetical protein n=1 Tax=Viridibacterium curvum TaxID=1101404 RepID=UPI0031E82723
MSVARSAAREQGEAVKAAGSTNSGALRRGASGAARCLAISLVVVACAGLPAVQAATPPKPVAAKPVAGSTLPQRLITAEQLKMLGERLTRNWAMTGLGALKVRAENQFEIDSKRYERLLKQMQESADSQDLRDNYALLGQLYGDFVELHKLGATPDNVKALADQNEELVWIAEKGAQMLRERVGAQQTEGLRLASEARALSQRIAKLYFFRSLGATAPFVAKDLAAAQKAYRDAIKNLDTLVQDKPRQEAILRLAELQWQFFAEALGTTPQPWDRQATFESVAKASDSLLVALDDLSNAFDR